MRKSDSYAYRPNAYILAGPRHRGRLLRVLVFTLALVLVSWGGMAVSANNSLTAWFTGGNSSTIQIQSAMQCLGGGSWEQAPQQILSQLQGAGQGLMNQAVNQLTSQFQQMVGEWVQGIVGGQILNLSQTTQHISEKVLNGFQEVTKINLKWEDMIKSKPGGLQMKYCYSDYSDMHSAYGQLLRSRSAGPLSGDWKVGAYYSTMIKSGTLAYPDANESVYSADPTAYVDQVAKTTVGMAGPGTGLNELISKSSLPPEEKERFTGVGMQMNALAKVNTALATDGADAVTYSADIWRRLSQFNPDSWDTAYPEQAMKDIPKLLYVQNQMMAKLLRLEGERAIQEAAIGQTKTREMSQQALIDLMNSSRLDGNKK